MSRFSCLLLAFGLLACLLLAGGIYGLLLPPRTETLILFDGKSTAGWVVEGDADVKDGELVLGGGGKTWARVAPDFDPVCVLQLEYHTENDRAIQFQWHHRELFGGGSHSVSLDRSSRDPAEWIEAIFEGKQKPGGAEWVSSCKWRVVGDPAFTERDHGGSASMPHSAFVAFEIPAGQKLYLRNVRATTDVMPLWPWLLLAAAVALGALSAIALAIQVVRHKIGRASHRAVRDPRP